ncbi:hypothetical protein P692DRAFT_20747758, partial [Suillus brevipes Sb2]
DASSILFLLTSTVAIAHLVKYVNNTKFLKNTFGEVPMSKKTQDLTHHVELR